MRCFLCLFAAFALFAQSPFTPAESRGKSIFERGDGGGSVTAMAAGGEKISASVLPCAGCHGSDGKGKREAGVVPSNITWNSLTRPYTVTDSTGRTRPPYTERLLRRAFTLGVDAGGNALNAAMPRFQMSLGDADDLVAYIKKLGVAAEPGIIANRVRLGVIYASGRDNNRVLLNYFSAINAEGGIFGRTVELVFFELPAERAIRREEVQRFVREQKILAVAFADMTDADAELSGVFDQAAVPVVATMARPEALPAMYRWVFYLDDGSTGVEPGRRAAAAAEIICEALRRTGRELSRAGLLQALESFSNVNTSLGQPITFGPARRIGFVSEPSH